MGANHTINSPYLISGSGYPTKWRRSLGIKPATPGHLFVPPGVTFLCPGVTVLRPSISLCPGVNFLYSY